jgi:hypothetical protein
MKETPPEEVNLVAGINTTLSLINKIMFKDIQELQKHDRERRSNKDILEEVNRLDQILNDQMTLTFKIKGRALKGEMKETLMECK